MTRFAPSRLHLKWRVQAPGPAKNNPRVAGCPSDFSRGCGYAPTFSAASENSSILSKFRYW